MDLGVEKIYVLHYTRLRDRKNRLDRMFSEHDIEVEYFLKHDQEELSKDIINDYYKDSQVDYIYKFQSLYGNQLAPYRSLNIAQISCTIKHYNCIKLVAENCQDYGMILEDDVVFNEDFVNRFNRFLSETPNDWDAIFLGCCGNLHIPQGEQHPDQVAYVVPHPASRGGDSYLLRQKMAEKISSTMKPFTTISDWELAYQLYHHNAKVYWWEPSLIIQGSQNGLYNTTLDDDHHRQHL